MLDRCFGELEVASDGLIIYIVRYIVDNRDH